MTTATGRRAGLRGSAVRCARALVVALLAALAVLIHHDTMSAATPARATRSTVGMDHATAAMTMTTTAASAEHGRALQAATMAMDHDSSACPCPCPATQHCSAGDVSTAKLAPPPAVAHVGRTDASHGVFTRQGLLGAAHRAPPDLSVLSQLLI